ncbi:ROK family protein [Salegentibacter sp. F14]
MSNNIIGIDIGATKTQIGVVQGDKVVKEISFPTSSKAEKEHIMAELISGIESISQSDFLGIGIGVPGLINEEKGIVYDLSNIPSWKEVFLKKCLEDHFNRPVKISNDANMFALGEKAYGKGKVYENMIGITLGSGFGTGIIINNKLYSGTLSGAGELSEIPYLDKTIEEYCSGKFFYSNYGVEGSKIYLKAKEGETEALEIFNQYGKHLGNAVKLIISVLSPEAIFFGGSISKSFLFFERSLRERIETFPLKKITKQLVVAPSYVSNVSILGAAALIRGEVK